MTKPEVEHVVVKTLTDIKRAVAPYDTNGKPRETLISGFDQIKTKVDAYNKDMADLDESKEAMGDHMPVRPIDPIGQRTWVDDIIAKRLGGTRDGLLVKWTVADGTYVWDPYTRALTKCC